MGTLVKCAEGPYLISFVFWAAFKLYTDRGQHVENDSVSVAVEDLHGLIRYHLFEYGQ